MSSPTRRYPALFLTVAACLALAGCLNLKPVRDEARFFVLVEMDAAAPDRSERTASVSLGINPVSLPDYLRNNRWAIRRANHEIDYAENLLWAEPLEKSIRRVVALDLANLVATDRVLTDSWSRRQVDYELMVTLHRFEWLETGEAILEAQWQWQRGGAETIAASGRETIRETGSSPLENPATAVATLNGLLHQLSQRMAQEFESVRALP